MSGLENSTFRCIRAALVVALLMPGAILAMLPARQSRMMIIHRARFIRWHSGDLSIRGCCRRTPWLHAETCGCMPKHAGKYLQCSPNADRYLRVSRCGTGRREQVVISAFSSNVTTPQG